MLALWHAIQLLSVNTFLTLVFEQLDGAVATELAATDDELSMTVDELIFTDDTGAGGKDDELISGVEDIAGNEDLSGSSGSPEHAVIPINSRAVKYLYIYRPIDYFFHKVRYSFLSLLPTSVLEAHQSLTGSLTMHEYL